jgi:ribulose-phosphate 3-epimerase
MPKAFPQTDDRPASEAIISASIMCADSLRLGDQVRELEQAGVDWLHVDIMDAHFVPNMPLGLEMLAGLRAFTALPLDVHLMVEDNRFFVERVAKGGVNRVSIHLESARHADRQLAQIRELGMKAGAALNPGTPLSSLDYVLDRIDWLLLMTVNPGFAGQEMAPSAIRKIQDARRCLAERRCDVAIQVDGNVSLERIPAMVAAGADILVGGSSSVFLPGRTIAENVALVRKAAAAGRNLKKAQLRQDTPGRR